MGNLLDFFSKWSNRTEKKILMVGLDGAGKTTVCLHGKPMLGEVLPFSFTAKVLYKLRLGEQVRTIPTIGFNLETVQYNNISFAIWDIGGQDKIRPLWKYYFQGNDAIIYVVDSSDMRRIDESAMELNKLMKVREREISSYFNSRFFPFYCWLTCNYYFSIRVYF
jgi:GTPase SAR1 family protein